MMRFILVFAFFVMLCPALKAQELQFYTESYPPLNFMDERSNELRGISVEIVDELMRRTGFNYDIKMAPWKRGYELTLSQNDTCLFTTGKLTEREDLFKWIMPLSDISLVLFSKKDQMISLNSLNEAAKYRIGGYLGDVTVDYLVKNHIPVETTTTDKFNLRKLQNGRIDLWATGEMAGLALAQEEGESNIQRAFTLTSLPGGIACNLQVSDIIITRLQTELDTLHKEGFVAQVYRKYLPDFTADKPVSPTN